MSTCFKKKNLEQYFIYNIQMHLSMSMKMCQIEALIENAVTIKFKIDIMQSPP